MAGLFLLSGLTLGLWIGFVYSDIQSLIVVLLAAFPFFALSLKRKMLPWFCLSFLIGFGLGFLYLLDSDGSGIYRGLVVKANDNYVLLFSQGRLYYLGEKGNSYEIGDILLINGQKQPFVRTTYESQFDFGQYLRSVGVYKEIVPKKGRIETLFAFPYRLKEKEEAFLSHFDAETAALLRAGLFNRKDYSSQSIASANDLQVLFLFSSSGLIASFFLGIFETIARWRLSKINAKRVTLALAIFLTVFSPWKVGLHRLWLIRGLDLINTRYLNKRFAHLDLVGISGAILLLLNRYCAYSTGFLLGYGASYTLYFCRGILDRYKRIPQKGISFILLQLFVFPCSVKSSGSLHFLTPFFVLLLIPYAYLFYGLGFISFLIYPFPGLLNPFGQGIVWLLSNFQKADVSILVGENGPIVLFLYYLIYYASLFLIELGFALPRRVLVLGFLTGYLVSFAPVWPMLIDEVCFINVGQGDSILIHSGPTTVLLDSGGSLYNDLATGSLIPYLRKQRIYHIDAFIASHQDYDHVGAFDSLNEHFEVRRKVENKEEFPLDIGDLHFENLNIYQGKEENETSLVLSLNLMGKSWLFTGDAPKEIEKKIIVDHPELDIDILKVGHHGSKTSTSPEFLDAITPEEAIISVGAKNGDGHPSPSVIEELEKRNIKIRRTDVEGSIEYRSLRGLSL